MNVTVEGDATAWGTSVDTVRLLAERVLGCLVTPFGVPMIALIVRPSTTEFPFVASGAIAITARGRFWCQYLYQMGHETCHVLIGADAVDPVRSFRVDEILCEAASLYVLARMAEEWGNFLGDPSFANRIREYLQDLLAKAQAVQHPTIGDPFHDNYSPTKRIENSRMALPLLDLFLEDPSRWREARLLPERKVDLKAFFDEWRAAGATGLPDRLDPFRC